MKITIKKLSLKNFKGIKNLSISFDETITNVFGDNATGKTTIFDAFTWLFFGKESTDRKDFNIKNTVDTSLNRQNHEVSAVIEAEGSEHEIKRVFKEKWTKRKGASEAVFTGNETEYFWNEVPVNGREFNTRIQEFIKEDSFKLISNPAFFNALHWKERRNILFQMAGEISDLEIATGNEKFEKLLQNLNGKSFEEYKKMIAAKKKPIKETLEAIPTRIDEVISGMPEMGDASLIKRSISNKEMELAGVEQMISDRSKAAKAKQDEILEHQKLVFQKKQEVETIKGKLYKEIQNLSEDKKQRKNQLGRDLSENKNILSQLERQRDRRSEDIASLEVQIANKRNEWAKLNTELEQVRKEEIVFDEHVFNCPTCRRAFETDDIDQIKKELQINFDKEKEDSINALDEKLKGITAQGQLLASDKERLQALDSAEEILATQQEIKKIENELTIIDEELSKLPTLEDSLLTDEGYLKASNELADITAKTPEYEEPDMSDLNAKKNTIRDEIRDLEKEIAKEEIIKANKERVEALKKEEKELAAELSNLEGAEFTLEAFTRKKVEEVEKRINGMFKHVSFKMFNTQVNGGIEETCETMMKGVPYSDLNNAARINAGLDIINTLSNYFDAYAPIFIDNAESVTKLIDVQSQVIRLVVSENDKKLRVA